MTKTVKPMTNTEVGEFRELIDKARKCEAERQEAFKKEHEAFGTALKFFREKNGLTGDVIHKQSGTKGRIQITSGVLSEFKPWLYFYPYCKNGTLAANPLNRKLMLPVPLGINLGCCRLDPEDVEKSLERFAELFEPAEAPTET